ncbi:hypothetical protein GALLR39Z86_03710 [Glycomyces algeriensis]|uniref:Uncharacterized protein n=1 Tax=Glycomyces algeriensis TaxID=256037 RepID=A0A9W6G4S7_9ACTN|nr:hypothetical protein GALLR39Z86_03710 [Glycomyces algeriensis]
MSASAARVQNPGRFGALNSVPGEPKQEVQVTAHLASSHHVSRIAESGVAYIAPASQGWHREVTPA